MTDLLTWMCEVCNEEIRSKGHIRIDLHEVRQYRRECAEHRLTHTHDGLYIYTGDDCPPDLPSIHIAHDACVPVVEHPWFPIGPEKDWRDAVNVFTWPGLVVLMLYWSRKMWFHDVNVHTFLQTVLVNSGNQDLAWREVLWD